MQIQGRDLSFCYRREVEGRGDCGGEQKPEQMHYHTEPKQDFPECSAVLHQARCERFALKNIKGRVRLSFR